MSITCEEALKKLYEVIDKEADEVDTKKVQEHLKSCKSCMSRYEFESMFKHFVVKKAESSQKHEQLRNRILSRISEAESSGGGGLFGGRFRFGAVLMAAAAALVIFVISALALADFYRHKEYTYPFEAHHMENRIEDVQSATVAQTVDAGRYLVNDLHLAVNGDEKQLRFIDAGTVEIQDKEFVHLRYLYQGKYVSFFMGNAEGVNLPDFERQIYNDKEYFYHECRECKVIYWYVENRVGEKIVIVVTEVHDLDLRPTIPTVKAI